MEFIKAIEILKRMCDKQENCFSCPLNGMKNCYGDTNEQLIKSEQILTDWDKAHPVKTYLTDFLSKYPNAKMGDDGLPDDICPDKLGYCETKGRRECDCTKCWNTSMEDK